MEDAPHVAPVGGSWKIVDPAAVRAAIGHGAKLVEKKFKTKAEAERHLAARASGEAVAAPTEAEIAAKYKHVRTSDGKHRLFIGAKMMEFDTEEALEKKKAALVKAALKKAKSAA